MIATFQQIKRRMAEKDDLSRRTSILDTEAMECDEDYSEHDSEPSEVENFASDSEVTFAK